MNKSIAVAGTGYVGLSISVLLAQHNHVTAVDIIPEKVSLTLFTEDQQSFPINAKIVLLQSKAKERSLTTFQETRYEINRYCNFVHNGEPP